MKCNGIPAVHHMSSQFCMVHASQEPAAPKAPWSFGTLWVWAREKEEGVRRFGELVKRESLDTTQQQEQSKLKRKAYRAKCYNQQQDQWPIISWPLSSCCVQGSKVSSSYTMGKPGFSGSESRQEWLIKVDSEYLGHVYKKKKQSNGARPHSRMPEVHIRIPARRKSELGITF